MCQMIQLPAALPADISIAEGIKARINVPYSECRIFSKSRDPRDRSGQTNAGRQPMNVHLTHVDLVIGYGVYLVLRPDDLHNGHHLSGIYQNYKQRHESGILVWISLDLQQPTLKNRHRQKSFVNGRTSHAHRSLAPRNPSVRSY